MNNLPSDPIILYSYINTQLRDRNMNLDQLCEDLNVNRKDLEEKLLNVGFVYNPATNQFS